MTRIAGLCVVVLAACDFGIGSDPDPNPPARFCAPGHTRETANGPCLTSLVPGIVIDGQTTDWAGVVDFPITGGTLALAGNNSDGIVVGEDSDLLLRATFPGGPLDTVVLALSASPVRPASGGVDRISFDATGVHYEKNDIALTPATPQAALAPTADGFEARVLASWLAYQGALRMQIVGTRAGGEVVRGETIDVCFGYRSGFDALPANACEVTQ